MVDEKIERWIEKKLREGVDRERIKESLKETGHDPSTVDHVEDPFEDSEENSENVFEKEESSSEEKEEDGRVFEEKEDGDKTSEDRSEGSKNFKIGLPDTEIFSDPKKPDKKYLIGAGALLVLILFILAAPQILERDYRTDIENSAEGNLTGCMDQGVLIESIDVENGKTVADLDVTRKKSTAVLKVFREGELVGKKFETFIGSKKVVLDTVGDKAVFHPVGCKRYVSEKEY